MRRILFLPVLLLVLPFFGLRAAGEVDLLWQGETYTPPFYEGRSLWGKQTQVRVMAVVHLPNAQSLYYRWTKNGTVMGSLSGVNKRSLTFVDSVLSLPLEVKVDIRDGENGKILGSSSVWLKPVQQRVEVIESNNLYGLMLHKAVGSTFSLPEKEVTFTALPLYSPVPIRDAQAITYTWTTNTGETRTGNKITYRAPEDSTGSSSIRLTVKDSNVLSLPLVKEFLIQFNSQNGF